MAWPNMRVPADSLLALAGSPLNGRPLGAARKSCVGPRLLQFGAAQRLQRQLPLGTSRNIPGRNRSARRCGASRSGGASAGGHSRSSSRRRPPIPIALLRRRIEAAAASTWKGTVAPNMPFQPTRRPSLRSGRSHCSLGSRLNAPPVRRCAQVLRRASLPSVRDALKVRRQLSLGGESQQPKAQTLGPPLWRFPVGRRIRRLALWFPLRRRPPLPIGLSRAQNRDCRGVNLKRNCRA